MAISNRQIGWSQEENLLWQISKQLDNMDSIMCTGDCPTTTSTSSTTTTTSTTLPTMCYCYTVESDTIGGIDINWIGCDGTPYSFSSRDLPQPFKTCAQEGTLIVTSLNPYTISGGTSICTIDGDCCNCREVVSVIEPYDVYDCLGVQYICPVPGSCRDAPECMDISLPYNNVVPSENTTVNCNCNTV